MTRKQKAAEGQPSPSSKKPKNEEGGTTTDGGDFEKEYQEFGKAIRQHLSIDQMREILKINDQEYNSLVPDEAVVTTWSVFNFFHWNIVAVPNYTYRKLKFKTFIPISTKDKFFSNI